MPKLCASSCRKVPACEIGAPVVVDAAEPVKADQRIASPPVAKAGMGSRDVEGGIIWNQIPTRVLASVLNRIETFGAKQRFGSLASQGRAPTVE